MSAKWPELYRSVVMPAHCDQYGHMNVRQYAAFFDDAGWQLFPVFGVSLTDLRARGLGSVVATMTIDFHHEITAGQLILVTGAITRVGGKSHSYELRMFEVDSKKHCATQKATEVCFDTKLRKSAPWPEDIKATLQAACQSSVL